MAAKDGHATPPKGKQLRYSLALRYIHVLLATGFDTEQYNTDERTRHDTRNIGQTDIGCKRG